MYAPHIKLTRLKVRLVHWILQPPLIEKCSVQSVIISIADALKIYSSLHSENSLSVFSPLKKLTCSGIRLDLVLSPGLVGESLGINIFGRFFLSIKEEEFPKKIPQVSVTETK